MIKLLYTYGIQPGSALILFLYLGVTHNLMVLCIDYVELAVGKSAATYAYESNAAQIIMEMLVLIELVIDVTCLGYGVIILGKRQLLIAWLVSETVFMLIYETELIWYLIELFVKVGLTKGETYLVTIVVLYYIVYTLFYYAYEINLGVRCLPLVSSTSTISELEPIGKGFGFIWEFYKNNGKAAASLVLMSEIMMNIHVFLERHVVEYGLGFNYMDDEVDRSTALYIEETVIRYIRIGVCAAGFFLTYKERQVWMFNWCLVYFSTVAISFGVFTYLVFMWRAVHSILTLVYFCTFVLNLLYRTAVLFVCMRYSDAFLSQQRLPL